VPNQPESIEVFFYGLFMDEMLLQQKGLQPKNFRVAQLNNYALKIGNRATLVPSEGSSAHGVLFTLTQKEIDELYSDRSVSMYRPEEVSVRLADGELVSALCFNLPSPPAAEERNPEYASKLRNLAAKLGLPSDYVASIK
jgi:Gamma-glutamyl cyclotransferase, AIG2-like